MPRTASTTDTTSEAQGRFVVSLPKDVGKRIDGLIKSTAEKMRELGLPGVEMSRAQMVQTLVADAIAAGEQRAAKAAEAASEAANGTDG